MFYRLGQAQIGTSATAIFTVSAGEQWVVKAIKICNTTEDDAELTLYEIPNAGSAGDATTIRKEILRPLQTIQIMTETGMEVGAKMSAVSDVANAITITISGNKFTL